MHLPGASFTNLKTRLLYEIKSKHPVLTTKYKIKFLKQKKKDISIYKQIKWLNFWEVFS